MKKKQFEEISSKEYQDIVKKKNDKWFEKHFSSIPDNSVKPEKEKKPSKYRNIRIKADGYTFDSKKEYERYLQLKALQDSGKIFNLEIKPKFTLIDKNDIFRACVYIPDFCYCNSVSHAIIVEDVKPFDLKKKKFRLTKDYIIKKKLMYDKHNLIVQEI